MKGEESKIYFEELACFAQEVIIDVVESILVHKRAEKKVEDQ